MEVAPPPQPIGTGGTFGESVGLKFPSLRKTITGRKVQTLQGLLENKMMVNVLDPKLPWLASNAAVELDLLINGHPADLEAVRQLAEHLRQALDKPTTNQPACGLHVDTETETILGQAFTKAGDDSATILGRLMQRTEEISEQLSSAEPGSEQKALERLRDFCLALSQSAAAYRQSVIDVRPPHPYRR